MTLDYKLNHENVVGVVFPCFSNIALCVENKLLLIEHNSEGYFIVNLPAHALTS